MRDSVSQDYADQRYYAVGMGRFGTPDPYMANNGGPGDPAEPASWNKYAYVVGDPINYTDPSGQSTGQHTPDPPDPNPAPPIPGPPLPIPHPGPEPLDPPQRLFKDKLLKGANTLLSKTPCADFVLGALQAGFLDENLVTSADQLGTYQRGIYDSLSAGSVSQALAAADFDDANGPPARAKAAKNTQLSPTRTIAIVALAALISTTLSLIKARPANIKLRYMRASLIWNISDANFAKAVGVYKDGMGGLAASEAWNAKLKEKCK